MDHWLLKFPFGSCHQDDQKNVEIHYAKDLDDVECQDTSKECVFQNDACVHSGDVLLKEVPLKKLQLKY